MIDLTEGTVLLTKKEYQNLIRNQQKLKDVKSALKELYIKEEELNQREDNFNKNLVHVKISNCPYFNMEWHSKDKAIKDIEEYAEKKFQTELDRKYVEFYSKSIFQFLRDKKQFWINKRER